METETLVITSGVRAEVGRLLANVDTLIIERPTFMRIPQLAAEMGITVIQLPWEEILAGFGADRSAAVWLTSPARNPDGRTLTW